MKKSILPLFPVIILFLLLLFPSLSFEGAKKGLLLWFNIVLPTLLPFMLFSSLIVSWNGVGYLTSPLKPLLRLFHLSQPGSYALICGLLCGYPMGPKTAADLINKGTLTKKEGKRLMAIAGSPSPMFLAGYIKMNLPSSVPFWHVAAALYAPVILLSFLSELFYREPLPKVSTRSAAGTTADSDWPAMASLETAAKSRPFDEIMMSALELMVKIGGYIMLFSILAVYAGNFIQGSTAVKPLLLGFIEMTTGIQAISSSMKGTAAAAAVAATAAFGGLSSVFQTKTVIKNAGLSIRHYVLWKLLHAGLTGILVILLSYL